MSCFSWRIAKTNGKYDEDVFVCCCRNNNIHPYWLAINLYVVTIIFHFS